MIKIILALSLFSASIYATTLDTLIQRALDENPSLASITHRISANKSTINVSNQFSNPTISYTQNTIDDDQAMSKKTVLIQQKLPYFGKRESLKNVALAEEGVLTQNLEQARVALVNAIKNQAYNIWELEELYKIIQAYEDLTRQNIELFESYTSTSDNQHMGIMSAELTLSDLRIQKSTLNAQIHSAYAKLSYLAAFKVKSLDIELLVMDMPTMTELSEGLTNNKNLAIKEKEVQKSQAMVESADLNNYPDVNLIGGYSYRKNFDNYWTFGVGVSLPIYGTEDYQEEAARKLTLSAQSLKEDTKIAISADFESTYVQMKSAYEIYHIVHDEALPQVEHMFELTSSSIATGGDLFKYIDILVQKLKLEQKSIAAVAAYNRADAKISALQGEI